MSTGRVIVSFISLMFLFCNAAVATDYYVDAENGDDWNSGTSSADAWRTLARASVGAHGSVSNPAKIFVAAGTYSASTNGEQFPFELKSHTSVIGEGTVSTILDGENEALHVVACVKAEQSSIEGLAIQCGNAEGFQTSAMGGGVYCRSCTGLTIQNCTITRNSGADGGGLCVLQSAEVSIVGCKITYNTVEGTESTSGTSLGGGLFFYDSSLYVVGCVFSDNEADSWGEGGSMGGAICGTSYELSSQARALSGEDETITIIRDCVITYCSCSGEIGLGGGVCVMHANVQIEGCTFELNNAVAGGALLWGEGESDLRGRARDGESDGLVKDCIFNDNFSSYGGAISIWDASPTIHNCIIANNSASYNGGGLELEHINLDCSPEIVNCTIADNTTDYGMGGDSVYCYGATPEFENCIIWGGQDDVVTNRGEVYMSYCCSHYGGDGDGNIYSNPSFVTGPLGDYYLSCEAAGQGDESPCIDAGSDTAEAFGLEQFTTRTDCCCDTGTVDMGYHYPVGGDEPPEIECYLNDSQFSPGEHLVGSIEVENYGDGVLADVYVAFVMPDGGIICITDTGLAVGISPWAMGWSLYNGFHFGPEIVISTPVPGGLATADYMFAAALSQHGQLNFIGDLSIFPFSIVSN
ncbi:MAG: right-handed parallel beta-helix repeat-containing protein [Candidatus Coatesbacteria bacterium]|nr:right-handed parallel beta-helix repeat-containing protein [Candidatus Coatesbacteria bacterium]